jgi:hypothetical protein
MRVPIYVYHHDLEDFCYYDEREKSVICSDYHTNEYYSVDEVEFEYTDLEDIVEEYTDDIIDILLSDKLLTNILLKKLKKLEEKKSR